MEKIEEINDKAEDFIRAINIFTSNPKGFFLIAGTNGNGKTYVAKAIYNKLWVQNGDNKFWNCTDLRLRFQDDLANYKSTNYLLQQCVEPPLLILDDVGTVRPSEAFRDFLYIIADKRFEAKHVSGTILTTNLNSRSMRELFGDAFVSRVASGLVVRHDGPDRRITNF